MTLQLCLNGARHRDEHGHLPVTASHAAQDIASCMFGISSVHVHPRDDMGRETLDPEAIGTWLTSIRTACRGIPIGVSTGEWIAPINTRLSQIMTWTHLPDFASVNFHEDGAQEIAKCLLERGVGVEAGLWSEEGAENFRSFKLHDQCLRILIELPDNPWAECIPLLKSILSVLESCEPCPPILLHGEGQSVWPAIAHASRHQWHARVGLEDTLMLPNLAMAASNAELVKTAAQYRALQNP